MREYRKISDLEDAERYFQRYTAHIIFVMSNGAKICNSFREVKGYYRQRCAEMEKQSGVF